MADQNEQGSNGNGGGQSDSGGTQTAQITGTVQVKPQGGKNGDQKQGDGKADDGKKDDGANGQKKEENPKKKTRRNIIIAVVVLVLLVAAGLWYWHSTFYEDTDDAQVNGNLYQVSSRVAGQVIHVDVQEQQTVKAGQPIAEIDPRDLEVALEQAKANLADAQAEYVQATVNVPITSVNVSTTLSTSGQDVQATQAAVQQAQAQAGASQARIAQAKAQALKAQLDVDRYTPLVQKDVISKQQYDAAVATSTAAQAMLDEAQRNAGAQQQMVQQARQRLAQARAQQQQSRKNGPEQVKVEQARAAAALAQVKQAQSKVDQAQLNLSYAHIVAPIDGIVSKKNVSVGENLSVGQDLLTIVPLTDLWVTANFKETQLAKMQQGQSVSLSVDALGGRNFDGKVTQIGGATGSILSLFPPENATGNYVKVVQRIPVRIDFTNLAQQDQDEALRPGMSVEPKVTVK